MAKSKPVNRNFKDRMFIMLFSEKKELLELYNAINGTAYNDPELLEINTLENAIYLSMHNDISFIIDARLSLYEHQSTFSPNLPLRYLFYVSDLLSAYTDDKALYSRHLILIPTPKFVIFYNGEQELEDRMELRLSDAYTVNSNEYSLELKATLLNINPPHNPELLDSCKTLKDYSIFTSMVRERVQEMSIDDAVEETINYCIEHDILADFLRKNRAEVKAVSIYEYDQEKHLQQEFAEGHAAGVAEGHAAGVAEGHAAGIAEGHAAGIAEGHAAGVAEERNAGIHAIIQLCKELSFTNEQILKQLQDKFPISESEAEDFLAEFKE